MASNPIMELEIWKGEWGLPSVDVHCLEVMVRRKYRKQSHLIKFHIR